MTPKSHALVCDDERHIVRLIQVNLERQGWRVTTAYSGQEALEKMRDDRPDLLILDSQMPGMSGREVVQAMRDDPALADIKVILLKEKDDDDWPDDDPPSCITFSKPATPDELGAILGSELGKFLDEPYGTPDLALRSYLESCREQGKAPSAAVAGQLLKKTHGLGFSESLQHIKAYALEQPGSFPNVRVSSPAGTIFWILLDLALAAWTFSNAWRAYNRGDAWWIFLVIMGFVLLLMAKGQIAFLVFLAKRKSQKTG